ncbi:MAG: hypothetical protein KBF37_10895 [Saprospiraceae bacterium]|jgi:DNA-binding HxlR family transcriptional regulator/SAM-dependent methyltransferase|nr:hypothetical protein [Saprospiraceae bacterium]MBP9210813.1 hypothetical protein [Saprospiraceae bacterium]MBV6472670.1 Mitomycin biosynthesis 6-O-methyltransferase [Saprospiraceae bacterium]
MSSTGITPPHVRAFELLGGIFSTQVIAALARYGIFEAISSGKKSLGIIANECGVNENVLSRSMRFAEYSGIVRRDEDHYSLTDVGMYFLKETPGNLTGSLNFISAAPWRDSWSNFWHCLKTGEPAFDFVHGQAFFDYLDAHPEYGNPFHGYMTQMTSRVAPEIAAAYDFGAFETVCDVGGGQGILLKAILDHYPDCKGILYDMENAMANHVLGSLGDRVTFTAGSFFDDVPPADCMVLKTIIHDWNDENSMRILSNCSKSLKRGGRVILVEQVVEEPHSMMALFYDLHMQVMLGGAERTEAEFRRILYASGLRLVGILPTKSPMKIIEATALD